MYSETTRSGINIIDLSHRQMLIIKDTLMKVLLDGEISSSDKMEVAQLISELNRVYKESVTKTYYIDGRDNRY